MPKSTRLRNTGDIIFFLSGFGAISSGVVVSLLQEQHGFAYDTTGMLLSLMSIGNLLAGFAAGVLPGKIGIKRTALLLPAGYALGYTLMGITGMELLLMVAFLLIGLAKGCTMNLCTILVSDNSDNRVIGMNLMHSCYAVGALLCPFLIAGALRLGPTGPMFALAVVGLLLWGLFAVTPFGTTGAKGSAPTDWSFLKSHRFWLLTGLIFCQNATETGVSGWMVTYFKGAGIIPADFSPYTVTVMWGATLIARLIIALVLPIRNTGNAMIKMSLGCIVFYFGLMLVGSPFAALLLLFAFAFAMAGMNPTAVGAAGRMTSVTSMGVMLPVASSGAIIMPSVIGLVAERFGIQAGMATNLIPCVGMLLLSVLVKKLPDGEDA